MSSSSSSSSIYNNILPSVSLPILYFYDTHILSAQTDFPVIIVPLMKVGKYSILALVINTYAMYIAQR